jgi:cell division ATPase FtsA
MMGFSFSRKEPELRLVLDVGTESVKAVLYRKREGKLLVFGIAMEYFDEFGVWEDTSFSEVSIQEAAFLKAAEKAVGEVLRLNEKKRECELFISFPPKLVYAVIVTMTFERKEPHQHISNTEAEEILAKGKEEGERMASKKAQEIYGMPPQGLTELIFQPISFSIDGYRVPSLRNFNGNRIVWSALAVFVRKQVMEGQAKYSTFAGDLAKKFGLHFSPDNVLSLAEGIIKTSPFLDDGIFVDIGGGETQVFMVQQKSLVATFDFPIGVNRARELLSTDLGLGVGTARELLERYAKGELTAQMNLRFQNVLKIFLSEWFASLKEGLEKEDYTGLASFFLFGGGGIISDIKKALETAQWGDIAFGGPLRVVQLFPQNLPHFEYRGDATLTSHHTSSIFLCYAR